MKKILNGSVLRNRLFALMACCVFLVLLTGCGMNTDMKISSDFAGERVIVCEELSNTSLMFSSAKVTDITECLKKRCPPQMEFSSQYTDDKQSKVVYTFTLKFDSLDDYTTKVAALIGRTPSVEYTYKSPKEQLFKSGFSLNEDFESKDLLAWVKTALKEELNLSRDLSSLTDTVKITMDGTSYDNNNLMSSRIKIDTIAQYRLSSIEINTVRYGDDDYEREVILNMPSSTVETLGKENIQSFMESVTADSASGQWLSDENKTGRYRISFSGTGEVINTCTAQLFGGDSSFGYVKDETLYTAFSETGVLSETLNFDRFPCESDGTCNATLTYKNMDASEFDGEKSTLSGSQKAQKDEGLSEDAKTVTLIYKKADSADIKLYSATVYKLSEVDVITEIGGDDKVSQSIVLASPIDTQDYGAQFAANYFSRAFEGSGMTVTVEQFNDSGTQFAVVIATPKDTAEKVTALLGQYIGTGNTITIEGQDKFELYNKRSVAVSVDIEELIKPSLYTGEIMYSFKGAGQAYDVDWTSSSGGNSDILRGTYRSNTFEHPISTHAFQITYHLRRINLIFVLLISALVIAVVGAVIMGFGWLALRKRRKNEEAKLEAVKTMALVKLPDGTETMMEVTPEEAANTVVIAPKNDDGLDDDDDEPENLWLFSTALRLFTVMAGVLFFLGYADIQWNEIIARSKSISGLHLVIGLDLMERTLEGNYFNAILLVIPVLIFLILSFRRTLPKLLSDLGIIGLSALQIWYLLGLPTTMEEQVNAFAAEVSKRMTMEMNWPYNYSIMIYILLLLGSVILVLIDTGLSIHKGILRKNGNGGNQNQ